MTDGWKATQVELTELKEKRNALDTFIRSLEFMKLPNAQQGLLNDQLIVMGEYVSILGERIFLSGEEE